MCPMWGIVLVLTSLLFFVLGIVHFWLSLAAHRRAGVPVWTVRSALHDLPRPERRKLTRALRRRAAVAPEHREAARRWAGDELLRRGMSWSLTWLGLAAAALLAAEALQDGESFWTLLVLVVLIAAIAVLMWGNQVTARRVLRDTPPPA